MKRLFDLVVASGMLLLFSPVIVIVAILVRILLGKGVFFRQERIGLNGAKIMVVKFRSMTNSRGSDGQLLPDSKRLTKFGKFLRLTSLDELPGLWNVLAGDVSIVGPRPQKSEFMMQLTPEQYRRHLVKPGITGWAQVNGRNAVDWKRRFELDVWYVDNQSIWLDIKIVIWTIPVVLLGKGVSAPGHDTTMPPFELDIKK